MTVTYDATDKDCENCGAPLEDYKGHWHASEASYCEECYDDPEVELTGFAQVIHRVAKAEESKQAV